MNAHPFPRPLTDSAVTLRDYLDALELDEVRRRFDAEMAKLLKASKPARERIVDSASWTGRAS